MPPERTLVLIHGFPLDSTLWRPQIERAPAGWRIVAPDLPGFGASARPPERTIEGMAREVLAGLDRLGVDRAAIGGLSMGGYVALGLYRIAPERFSALVLADTRATPDGDPQKDARRKMIALVRAQGAEAVAGEMLPKLLSDETHRSRLEVVAHVRRMIESNPVETIAAALEAMMARPDARPLLPRIAVPTLIVCGTEDTLTPPADSEAMHEAIPGSRLEWLAGAGHLSNLETPDPFSRVLHDFLGTLSDTP